MKFLATCLAIACTFYALAETILVRPAVHRVTLAEHITAELSARTNGASSDFLITKTNQTRFIGSPSVVENYWLRDVVNINATSAGYADGTGLGVGACLSPVSPRHCITAAHVGPYTNNVWILGDGTLYTNSAIAWTNIGGDILVCLMANTNPAFYRCLPDISAKVKFSGASLPPPVCVRLHDASRNTPAVTSYASGIRGNGQFGAFAFGQFKFGDYATGETAIVGDSSSAIVTVIHGEAVFIGSTFTASTCPVPGANAAAVNAAMSQLSTAHSAPVYELTVYDLSEFPNL